MTPGTAARRYRSIIGQEAKGGGFLTIQKFTIPQIEYYRSLCNFVGDEKRLFDLRAEGNTLEECCEAMRIDISKAKRISRRVGDKMRSVTNMVDMDNWLRSNYVEPKAN